MINIQVSVNQEGLGTVKIWSIVLEPEREDCWYATNDQNHESFRATSIERIMVLIADEILHKFC